MNAKEARALTNRQICNITENEKIYLARKITTEANKGLSIVIIPKDKFVSNYINIRRYLLAKGYVVSETNFDSNTQECTSCQIEW